MQKRVVVYVDGFNLYYGVRNYSGAKWLNLDSLCRLLLPHYDIHKIKYFTAQVSASPRDPNKPLRQQIFWRALRTIPRLEIIEGHFISHPVEVRPIAPIPGGPATVTIMKTEEKGSDVNLATHMIVDAVDGVFEIAVVISNDSDLALPIEIVRTRFQRDVIVFNPHQAKGSKPSKRLQQVATQFRPLRKGPVCASQFPATLTDARGTITKPKGW
jgi:NYN domain